MAFTPYSADEGGFAQASSGGGFAPFDPEKGFVDPGAPKPATNFVGSLISPFVRIGQVAGAGVARAFGAPEENIRSALESPVELNTGIFGKAKIAGVTPGVSEGRTLAGAALEAGSLFTPVGRIARGIGSVASFAGRLAPTVGAVGAGLSAGYAYDVGRGIQEGEEGGEEFKPGVATALGAAIPGGFAAIGAASRGIGASAPTFINSLIKPLNKNFTYGKNPGRAVAQEGITANSLEELQTGIAETRRAIGQRLQTVGSRVQGELTVSKPEILAPFESAVKAAIENNDQNLLARLVQARDAIGNIFSLGMDGRIVPVGSRVLDRLTFTQGVQLKRLIGDLTKWTGQQTDDETVNGALTRTYGVIKEALNDLAEKNSPKMAAEVRGLNERYADLTSAEIATKYRDVLEKRQNMINLPGKIGLAGSLIAAATTGVGLLPILAAISSIALDKALSSPAVKTRLAKALAKMAPDELTKLSQQNPGVFERLKRDFKFPGDALVDTIKNRPSTKAFGAAAIPAVTGFDNDMFKDKIVSVENERAMGTGTDPYIVRGVTGDLGKYQVSPASLKAWSKAWLGKEYSQQEFLKDPKAQEDFFDQFLAVVDRLKLTEQQTAVAWHMGWGELGTGPRETRDKRFLRKLGSSMKTEIAKEYLRRFNRVAK